MKKENQQYFEGSKEDAVFSPHKEKRKREDKKSLENAALELEKDIVESKEKQIKTLRIGLAGFVAVSVLLAISIAFLAPLKTSVPYLIRVDNSTGYVDKVEPYNASTADINESVTRYFIGKYITDRESYDWWNVEVFYDFVKETSSPEVFAAYNNMMKNDETSPLKVLNKNLKMNATVNSIIFLNEKTAQVRFTKNIVETNDKKARSFPKTTWVATVVFDFESIVKTEKQRLINPLGFRVISYKLDAEVTRK